MNITTAAELRNISNASVKSNNEHFWALFNKVVYHRAENDEFYVVIDFSSRWDLFRATGLTHRENFHKEMKKIKILWLDIDDIKSKLISNGYDIKIKEDGECITVSW